MILLTECNVVQFYSNVFAQRPLFLTYTYPIPTHPPPHYMSHVHVKL